MSKVIKLVNYKPDTYLEDLYKARKASEKHLLFIRDNQDSCYNDADLGREMGYQEMCDTAIYLYKRSKGLL